jgi:hypothetical protein
VTRLAIPCCFAATVMRPVRWWQRASRGEKGGARDNDLRHFDRACPILRWVWATNHVHDTPRVPNVEREDKSEGESVLLVALA